MTASTDHPASGNAAPEDASSENAHSEGTGADARDDLAAVRVAPDAGYAHRRYAQSLAEFGTPVRLPESDGCVLERAVPSTGHADAMGPYPLLACGDWAGLGDDLLAFADRWVSVSAVVDPFGPSARALAAAGADVARPFKAHFLIDLDVPYDDAVSKHHRYYARYAERNGVHTTRVDDPSAHLDEWVRLYDHLAERHDLTGIQRFSRDAFRRQLSVPGLEMFAAEYEGDWVAAHLWYEMGEVAYSHLLAHSEIGYDEHASYAIHRAALRHFRQTPVRWLNLGGGAGVPDRWDDADDGLSWFKKGWATTCAPSLLCGAVLQPSTYASLTRDCDVDPNTTYFPAYRQGELV